MAILKGGRFPNTNQFTFNGGEGYLRFCFSLTSRCGWPICFASFLFVVADVKRSEREPNLLETAMTFNLDCYWVGSLDLNFLGHIKGVFH